MTKHQNDLIEVSLANCSATRVDSNPYTELLTDVNSLLRARGYEPEITPESLSVAEYQDLPDGMLIPDFMTDGTDVKHAVRDGSHGLNFQLRETGAGEANTAGSSHFTAVATREDWSLPEIVEQLHTSGQIEKAKNQLKQVVRDGVRTIDVVAWALTIYVMGVEMERVVGSLDRFSKAGVSNDQAGDDFYDNDRDGRLVNLKHVSVDNQNPDWVYYQYDDRGNVVIGENCTDVHNAAMSNVQRVGDSRKSGVDIPGTVAKRTESGYYTHESRPHIKHKGGTYRYISW